jgi:Skp family chaperone for outer membrane proteins
MRRRRDNTLSLFAFQDIITGVAGVMLFILLLLVVQLTLRTVTGSSEWGGAAEPSAPQPSPQIQPPADRQQLQQMQQTLERLRRRSAELLEADAGDLDAQIDAAQAELHELMADAARKQSHAEAMQSQMSSSETNQQKRSTLERRNALKRQLEQLEQEQVRHAGGKLVAFKSASTGVGELWIIDMRGTGATIFNVESPQDAVTVSYQRFEPEVLIVQSIRSSLQQRTDVRNVVVLLRPSIAGSGSPLLDAFRAAGFRVALELLDEDTLVTRPSESGS